MSSSRKLLILGGLALAAVGMLYGLYYALFAEHQALDGMGAALTEAFVTAAERHLPQSNAAIDDYARTKYVYLRQVDVHSHWIGLAMLLIALGAAFDRVNFSERIPPLPGNRALERRYNFSAGRRATDHDPRPAALRLGNCRLSFSDGGAGAHCLGIRPRRANLIAFAVGFKFGRWVAHPGSALFSCN